MRISRYIGGGGVNTSSSGRPTFKYHQHHLQQQQQQLKLKKPLQHRRLRGLLHLRQTAAMMLLVMRLAHVVGAAAEITMLSVDSAHIVNVGDAVSFDCQFHADRSYNLFDYPVLWRKSQLETVGEDTGNGQSLEAGNGILQVNIMGNINEPFLSTNRFDATFTSAAVGNSAFRTYALQLSITNVAHEDSGNYTCEVRGPHSTVLRKVAHSLYVRNPVVVLVLTKSDSVAPPHGVSDPHASFVSLSGGFEQHGSTSVQGRLGPAAGSVPGQSLSSTQSVLRLIEGRPSAVRCDAVGGFPSPRIDLFIGANDISNLFMYRSECRRTGEDESADRAVSSAVDTEVSTVIEDGEGSASRSKVLVGMRRLECTAERWTHGYLPTADDDHQMLSCVATVPGLKPVVQMVRLDVDYSPRITCPRIVEALPGDDDVTFECDVSAKPPVSDTFWLIDENGTSVRVGDVTRSDFVMTRTELAYKTTRVQLHIGNNVERHHFRSYTLVSENKVGITTKDVRLVEKRYTTTVRPAQRHAQFVDTHQSGASAQQLDGAGPSRRSYKSSSTSSRSRATSLNPHKSVLGDVSVALIVVILATFVTALLGDRPILPSMGQQQQQQQQPVFSLRT